MCIRDSFYTSRSEGFARVRFTGTDYSERRVDLERTLHTFVTEMRSGNFHARPGRHCGSCDFDSLCDARRKTLLERKERDPRAVTLAAIAAEIK